MALSYRARKNLSIVILVIALPVYIAVAWGLLGWITDTWGRPSILVELAVYIGLGVLWAVPFKRIFRGIGQADPDQMRGRPPEG